MAREFSFGVVSGSGPSAVDNAVEFVKPRARHAVVISRTSTALISTRKKPKLTLASDNEGKLKASFDILQGQLVKRGILLKALDFEKSNPPKPARSAKPPRSSGVASERPKMVRAIKDAKNQSDPGHPGRPTPGDGPSEDDLSAIALLRGRDFVPIQFTNYR